MAAHGIRGELRVRSYTADPMAIGGYGALLDAHAERRFALTARGFARGAVIARIEGVADRNAAEALKGTRLYIRRSTLPPPAEDEYYHADLIGLAVTASDGRGLGRIAAVHDFGAGAVIEIRPDDGPTFHLPFNRRSVPEVDLAQGRVVVARDALGVDHGGSDHD